MSRKLDNRLMAAADMVREGAIVADIGTDHGYLIRYLVGSGKCPHGYAREIKPGPLESARKNIEKSGLLDKITLSLGDGLDGLDGLGISDFLILGMGGETIAEIILRHSWAMDSNLRFIVQPMTKAERMWKSLHEAGFVIENETTVRSGKFTYTLMTAQYSL